MSEAPRPRAPSLLRRWRDRAGLTQHEAALLVGCVDGSLWAKWERGEMRPNLKHAAAIEALTEGRIRCRDWFLARELPRVFRRASA